jgi:hypothetical protein
MIPLLAVLLTACEKEGKLPDPVKEKRAFNMDGFSVAPLDQYFDGVKVRELYAGLSRTSELAFSKDEIVMELKRKGDGKTVYQQKFNSSDATNEIPKFYFDGNQVLPRFEHPAPVGDAYTASFYFDFPKDLGAVDIGAEMVEYYFDWNLENPLVYLDTTYITLVTNIQPGKWSDYVTLHALPELQPTTPDSYFQTSVYVKKAGKDEPYSSKVVSENLFTLQLPDQYTTEGKVQSIFLGWKPLGPRVSLEPQVDLVRIFP